MTSFTLLGAAAVVFMVGGLIAVLAQLLRKDPQGLWELLEDTRGFAAAPLPVRAAAPRAAAAPAADSTEHPRLAA